MENGGNAHVYLSTATYPSSSLHPTTVFRSFVGPFLPSHSLQLVPVIPFTMFAKATFLNALVSAVSAGASVSNCTTLPVLIAL